MKYIEIAIHVSHETPELNRATFYLSDWETGLQLDIPMPAAKGFAKLREIAAMLGAKPSLEFNPYNPHLCSWYVHGVLDK